ncbi:MAG: hypothetical protein IPK82_42630 [Polyangiaceae bacterium]|nr:hypothetical protein [Polyangiaceae bacterium]
MMSSSQSTLDTPTTVSAWAPFLEDREIEEVQQILIHCDLTELRTLLASLDPPIQATVEQSGAPSVCLWKALHRFNRTPRTANGELPMAELLRSAEQLSGGRVGAARLKELREKVLLCEQEVPEKVIVREPNPVQGLDSVAPVSETVPPPKMGWRDRFAQFIRTQLDATRLAYVAHAGWFNWGALLALIGAAVVVDAVTSAASCRTFNRFENYAEAVAQLEAKATEIIYLGDEPLSVSPSGTKIEELLAREDISTVAVLFPEVRDRDAPRLGALRSARLAHSEKLRVCGASQRVFGTYSRALPPGAVAVWIRADGVSYLAIGGRRAAASDVRNEIHKDVQNAPLAQAMLNVANKCTKTETIAILAPEKDTKIAP